MSEIWKAIPNYEGIYEVSNLGNVKSLKWNKERTLKFAITIDGYYQACLQCNRVQKTYKVHQLVAIAFLNHIPCGLKLVVDHINDIKTDNRVENLQIVTNRFNVCKTQSSYSSNYKGVCWDKSRNKWVSYIKINGNRKHLGRFESEYEAHLKYQEALKSL